MNMYSTRMPSKYTQVLRRSSKSIKSKTLYEYSTRTSTNNIPYCTFYAYRAQRHQENPTAERLLDERLAELRELELLAHLVREFARELGAEAGRRQELERTRTHDFGHVGGGGGLAWALLAASLARVLVVVVVLVGARRLALGGVARERHRSPRGRHRALPQVQALRDASIWPPG